MRTSRLGNDCGYGILAALIDALCVLAAVCSIAAACAGILKRGDDLYGTQKSWIEQRNTEAAGE